MIKKIAIALTTCSLLFTSVQYSNFSPITKNVKAAGYKTFLYAPKEMVKKKGSSFTTSKVISRNELRKLKKYADYQGTSESLAVGTVSTLVVAPFSPYVATPVGIATGFFTNALPHYSKNLNDALVRSTATKFKVSVRYSLLRKGSSQVYIISNITATPVK
ncbi:hypothetical protein MRN59_11140 (plasmid) [Macrococcoides caseolyticum]|uniref:hypothetical protein n=1 Tax=Macrococcoides caseolyticum TaxID=69966 RepID=UPI00339D8FAE